MKLSLKNIHLTLGEFSLKCSLDLPPGQLISLLGPSGCGKTSLLKSIAGLYPLEGGEITLGERDITGTDPRFRKIGMVFQDYALFPHMNVEKNICYGMSLKGESARNRCRELLEMVELQGFEKRSIEELSGGEKQRIALARALASEPDLLLLDEPLSALDARLRKILRRQIRQIQMRTGITTLYVTHDQEEAMAISDHVVLMKNGRVQQAASPREIYRSPVNLFAGEFFGSANIIPLEEAENLWKGTDPRSIRGWMKDREGGALFFRPEACRITSGDGESGPGGEGRVVYNEYAGDCRLIDLAGADGTRVSLKVREDFEGHELSWTVSSGECMILY